MLHKPGVDWAPKSPDGRWDRQVVELGQSEKKIYNVSWKREKERGTVVKTTHKRRLCFPPDAGLLRAPSSTSSASPGEKRRGGYFWVDIPPKSRWMVEEKAPPLLFVRRSTPTHRREEVACVSNDVNRVTSVSAAYRLLHSPFHPPAWSSSIHRQYIGRDRQFSSKIKRRVDKKEAAKKDMLLIGFESKDFYL